MSLTSPSPHTTTAGTEADDPPFRMFVNRPKVYAADVHGWFRRLKWLVLVLLLAVYYVTPWIRWDRGPGVPDQAVLVDMAGRRAYFFFIEIWPQEVYYLTGLLIMGAFGIFFATTLLGRIWCGYACPQTVWTDLYMWVERKLEGPRTERIRLDKGPMTAHKFAVKTAKHVIWVLIALVTGGAWIFYFNDAPTLLRDIVTFQVPWRVVAFAGLFTGTTYFFAGWAREQICIYVCPWRSYQSAMVDEDTYLVTYQDWRGETRAPLRKSQSWEERQAQGLGDCIDCNACVHVCPTGTDIRKGQQISCIGCGLCVDACNEVMAKIGHPGNLILFDNRSNQVAKAEGKSATVRLLRPRTVIYALIILVVAGIMAVSLAVRPSLDVTVLRDRAPLFVTLSTGDVQNAYTVKILNKTHAARSFRVAVDGLANPDLSVASTAEQTGKTLTLGADPDSVATYRIFVRVPGNAVKPGSTDITMLATDTTSGEVGKHPSVFLAPEK